MRTLLIAGLASVLVAAVGCGPTNCDPRTHNPCGTAMPQSCDAVTRMCTVEKSCVVDADCAGGYQCSTVLTTCYRNCYNAIGNTGQDNYCQTGYRCNGSTVGCEKVTSCTPDGKTTECNTVTCDAATKQCAKPVGCSADGPCGAYACDIVNKRCRASCGASTDCATGKSCDTVSGTCA